MGCTTYREHAPPRGGEKQNTKQQNNNKTTTTTHRGRALQGLHDEPATFVVLDVGANLADGLRVTVAVEVVVLDLEELAHLEQDLERVVVLRLVGVGVETGHHHPHGNGAVERVERRLVLDDTLVLGEREL